MELRQLAYFMEVCKELHFTRAAQNLNIAQPTLSQQIKSLENEVGIPLFDRIGKTIVITEAGKILLKHSQRIFFEVEQAESAIRDLNGLERGRLNVGSLLTCVSYLLTPTILHYKQLYPDIELSVQGLRTDVILKGLLENELDLGVTFLPIKGDEFESIPLFAEELSLVVPSDHPLALKEEIRMEELSYIPTVLLPKSYFLRQLIDDYCLEAGVVLKPKLEMTALESLIQMVVEGIGVTVLPTPYIDSLKNKDITSVKLIYPNPRREIGLVYRKDKFMCSATRAFINQILEKSKVIV